MSLPGRPGLVGGTVGIASGVSGPGRCGIAFGPEAVIALPARWLVVPVGRPVPRRCPGQADVPSSCTGIRAGQIQGLELVAHYLVDELIQRLRITEADLRLRGMHVHVHLVRRHLQEQEGHWIAARHEQAAIRLLHRLEQAPVPHPAAVQEQVLPLAAALVTAGSPR